MSDENTKSSFKSKNMMYSQQLRYLNGTSDEIVRKIAEKLNGMKSPPKRYAIGIHDKDIAEDGKPVEPHVQVMMSFENARYSSSIAKVLGDKEQFIQRWDEYADNGFAYIAHCTPGCKNDHHYDPTTIVANFDYVEFIERYKAKVVQEESKENSISFMLDALLVGAMTKKQVLEKLSGSQYAKWHRQIEDVHAQYLRNCAEEWRQKMIAEGKSVIVIWIYGKSGTGKTLLARKIAGKQGKYFTTGSSRDWFQLYQGEHAIILDELRDNSMRYDDLLKILDPFSIGSTAPSRYYDKSLAADTIIITTPYDPYQYYERVVPDEEERKIDKYGQLLRRLTLILYMDYDVICSMKVLPGTYPQRIPGLQRPNPYSLLKMTANRPDPKDIFEKIFDMDTDNNENTTNDERR